MILIIFYVSHVLFIVSRQSLERSRGMILSSHCAHVYLALCRNCCLSHFICAFLVCQIHSFETVQFHLTADSTVKLIRPPGQGMSTSFSALLWKDSLRIPGWAKGLCFSGTVLASLPGACENLAKSLQGGFLWIKQNNWFFKHWIKVSESDVDNFHVYLMSSVSV